MNKDLERFVRDNRAAFDTEKPSARIWTAIENKLGHTPGNKKKVYKFKPFWLTAAAIVLVVAVNIYSLFINDRKDVPVVQPAGNGYIAVLDPAYAAEVSRFTILIDEKQAELKSLQADNPVLYEKFSKDIQKLDSTYHLLRNQLPVNPNKEELLQAMIGNLHLQISLLNQQLDIIQKIKQSNSQSL